MADPMDMAAIDDISIVTNLQIEPYIATTRDILAAIDRCYGASETLDAARRFTQERAQLRGGAADDDTDTDVSDAPIVQLCVPLLNRRSARGPVISISKLWRTKSASVTGSTVHSMSVWYMTTAFSLQSPPVSRSLVAWISQRKGNLRTDVCPLW